LGFQAAECLELPCAERGAELAQQQKRDRRKCGYGCPFDRQGVQSSSCSQLVGRVSHDKKLGEFQKKVGRVLKKQVQISARKYLKIKLGEQRAALPPVAAC